jgi:PhnB protein
MNTDEVVSIRYIENNVDEAVKFYRDNLDFQVDMHPAPGFAALSLGNLRLLMNEPGAGGAGKKLRDGQSPEPGGWNRLQISVPDLTSFYDQLRKKGVKFKSDIIEGQGGRQALVEDPSGNLIELFEAKQQSAVKPVPAGYHTVTPFLIAEEADKLIEFITRAFDGKLTYMMKSDDGLVRHATVSVGDSMIMVSSGTAQFKPMPAMLHLYVPDVDSMYKNAVAAGGTSLQEPANQFYGDRSGGIQDRWNNQWWIATHIEDVNDDEMKKREQQFRKEKGL